MAQLTGKARKKLPKELAVINADNCTGCEACIEVCPVDCIVKVEGEDHAGLQSWCQIDLERCVGCHVCVWLPKPAGAAKDDPYTLLVCPWDAIEMVPTERVSEWVASKGGPPGYVQSNWDTLVDQAYSLQCAAMGVEPATA